MPHLLQTTQVRLDWTDIKARVKKRPGSNPHVRQPGWHLSGILKRVLLAAGTLPVRELEEDDMPLCVALGLASEDWFVGLWPDMQWQPGERTLDNVTGTNDGLSMWSAEEIWDAAGGSGIFPIIEHVKNPTDLVRMGEEFKATWKSKRTHPIESETYWLWQMAGYCKLYKCNFYRLHVVWVNGDYKQGPPVPEYWTYLFWYPQEEIDTFWENVVLPNREGTTKEG